MAMRQVTGVLIPRLPRPYIFNPGDMSSTKHHLVVWATAVRGRSEANVHRSQNGELCGVPKK